MVGAITAVLRAIAEPGERVVINTPVYHPFFAVIEELGCELAEAPLVGGELDPEAIEQRFAEGAVALILCSPHNPTGGVPSREQLAAIADAAARHGAWVLADEIHAPLTLPGARHVPFLTVSEAAAERGIAFCSASKTFNVAGLHCAQIVTASEKRGRGDREAAVQRHPLRPSGRDRLRRRLPRRRTMARRRDRSARPQPQPAGGAPG